MLYILDIHELNSNLHSLEGLTVISKGGLSFPETGFQTSLQLPPHRQENNVLIVGSMFATKLQTSQFITLVWCFPVNENAITHLRGNRFLCEKTDLIAMRVCA